MRELIEVPRGLADVAVTATTIGDVVGDEGYYHYRGRNAAELARTATWEEAAALVLDESPEPLRGDRSLPPAVVEVLERAGSGVVDLRSGLSLLGAALGCRPLIDITPAERRADAVRLTSAFPTLVASVLHGRPVEPDPSLGHVADYLRMMLGPDVDAGAGAGSGSEPSEQAVAALQAYFVLTIDHGFNNSTFTTRVVASTGADLGACVVAGFTALTGPRHGAALERILDMLDGIGQPGNAEDWMRNEIASRRRLQGFGHSVYRAPDPRGVLMREMSATLAPERHALAVAAEDAGTRLLAGRRLVPNVDLHAAVVLEGCGVPRGWFGATFAAARMIGWCAHALEQATDTKIIRPAAHYVGPF